MKPVIFGLAGVRISDEERAFFREADPAGYILFKRNIENRTQLRALTDDLRALAGRDDLAILIDQEGGRVSRCNRRNGLHFHRAARLTRSTTAPRCPPSKQRAPMQRQLA